MFAAYYSPYPPCYYYISSFYGNIPRARHGLARSLIPSLSLLCGYVHLSSTFQYHTIWALSAEANGSLYS